MVGGLHASTAGKVACAPAFGDASSVLFGHSWSKSAWSAGRRQRSHLPVFSSYVFVFAGDEERIGALDTKRIAHLFPAPDRHTLTRDLCNVRAPYRKRRAVDDRSTLTGGAARSR